MTQPSSAVDDHHFAASLAEGAGTVLLSLRAETDAAGGEFDVRAFKDLGDARAQAWLADALASERPADATLSEEARDDLSRLDADRVWIIDPLDGTREFAERTDGVWRTDFAVHVALWQRGRGLTAGAVALPARGEVHRTQPASPLTSDDSVAAVLAGDRPLRLAASRSRPPAFVTALAERDDVELVPMGSAGVKVAAVVDGTVDAYLHAGGQYEWDSAAPVAIATAAGCVCTRLDGSPLVYNRENPWLPDLFVSHPALQEHVRGLLNSVHAHSVEIDSQEGTQS